MNKTVNINLGGTFFYIDEDAYQKMTRYFDAIKSSLNNSSGQDEILKDIEMRIAELISAKHSNDKQVINIKELDEVIAVMGQPEDYRIDDENEESTSSNFSASKKSGSKKLFRDKENGMIGGVLAGVGHFIGIDKVWLRILLLLAIWLYGFGFLIYIILWIVMPEAKTTTDKLEMRGEPINISNIEKRVRAEYDSISDRVKSVDYDKLGNQVKSGATKAGSSFGDFIISILKIIAKIIGVILVLTTITVLSFLLIGIFSLGSGAFIDFPWQNFAETANFTDYPIWSFGLLMFFAVGIPFFFLMILGFKLIVPTMKSLGNVVNYSLLAIWIIAIGLTISLGVNQAMAFSTDGRTVKKEILNASQKDTLMIKFVHNSYFAKDIYDRDDFMITEDSVGTKIIYSNDVNLRILKTDEKVPFIQIENEASGKTLSEAKNRAEKIRYKFSLQGNRLVLDNYFLTPIQNKFRNQNVKITLFLPVGMHFKVDESVKNYDRSDYTFFNLQYSSDTYIYKVGENEVICTNCPANETNDSDFETTTKTTILKVNGEDIITKETSSKNELVKIDVNGEEVILREKSNSKKGLTTDKNGVIIKNQ